MGGFVAIHGAAVSDSIAAVIAICPAGEEQLLRGLRDGSLEFRAGDRARADLSAWLGEHDLREAVELLGSKAADPDPRRRRRADPERVLARAPPSGRRSRAS